MSILSLYRAQNSAIKGVVLLVIVLILWMLSGVFTKHTEQEVVKSERNIAYQSEISISKLKHRMLAVSGVVDSKKNIKLVCEAEGKIDEVVAESGQLLKKGDVIAKVDLKNKRELYEGAKLRVQQSEIEFKSSSVLYTKKLGSEADLARTKASLSNAQAEFKKAEIALNNAVVVAPFDGYIDNIVVNQHDYMFGVAMPGEGNLIGTFVAADSMIVRTEISDLNIKSLKKGARASIRTLNGLTADGAVSFISKVINPASSSFPVEIAFQNPDFKIMNGQAVSVNLMLGEKQAHRLPQSALGLDADGNIGIKAIEENGLVRFYEAHIIDEESGYIWLADLPNRLNVILLGHAYINPGEILPMATMTQPSA